MEDCINKVEYPLYILNKTMEEFSFKEQIETSVKKFHNDISNAVFDFRYEMRKLEGRIRSCREASYSEENLGNYDWLFSFSKVFKEILFEIELYSYKFEYDESLSPDDKFPKQKVELSQVSLSTAANSKTKKTGVDLPKPTTEETETKVKRTEPKRGLKSISGLLKFKNFASMLYATPPQDDGSLLSQLHCKVLTSYCDVQEAARVS
ncbi:hypothetical protein HHI36_017557 [Cryptolaemus montrouzieri]|uniref:Uncharacterized protein n=1 Tax=Cryptolaemus montrouzieri TaxID=559131 RepID=A0ABD2NN80_9CUCU